MTLEDRGAASIFILNVAIINQLSAFLGGSSIVYFTSKLEIHKIILPSYCFVIATALIASIVFFLVGVISINEMVYLFLAGLFQGLLFVNQQVFLGRRQISLFNKTQTIIAVGHLVFVLSYLPEINFTEFALSYIISLFLAMLFSFLKIPLTNLTLKFDFNIVKQLFNQGSIIQIGSLAQQVNSRFSYYVLFYVSGSATVALFSVSLMAVEKLMLISRTFSTIQYSEISFQNDREQAQKITAHFLKWTLFLTLLAALFLNFIPEDYFLAIIGENYVGIKTYILFASPAIIILALSGILSHYYSGLGLFELNSKASVISMVITIFIGLFLIPVFEIRGAILTMGISYFIQFGYQLYYYTSRKRPEGQS